MTVCGTHHPPTTSCLILRSLPLTLSSPAPRPPLLLPLPHLPFPPPPVQSTTRVKPFICTMPMRLDEGWNQIQFNLSDFTRRAYGGWPAPGARGKVCV